MIVTDDVGVVATVSTVLSPEGKKSLVTDAVVNVVAKSTTPSVDALDVRMASTEIVVTSESVNTLVEVAAFTVPVVAVDIPTSATVVNCDCFVVDTAGLPDVSDVVDKQVAADGEH
jgi:hypothetical protein